MRRADLILGVVVTVVGAYALQMALHLAMFATSGTPGPGFFPRLISGLLTGLGVLLAVTSLRPRRAAERPAGEQTAAEPTPDPAGAGANARRVGRTGLVWLLLALAVPLLTAIGFVPAAALFVFVLLFTVERRRNWRAVVVALAIPLATSFVFTVLLSVQLPQGALSQLPLGI